jgi:hypothetical protein
LASISSIELFICLFLLFINTLIITTVPPHCLVNVHFTLWRLYTPEQMLFQLTQVWHLALVCPAWTPT